MGTTTRRRPSARTALIAAGALGIAGAIGATMAQWTDTAEVTGTITTGTFELTVTPEELGFVEFAPEAPQTSTHELVNGSTVPAQVDLDIAGFTAGAGTWQLEIAVGGETVYSGDPSGGVTDIPLGAGGDDLVLAPDGSVPVTFTLELAATDDSQDITDDVTFTFGGVQVADGDEEEPEVG